MRLIYTETGEEVKVGDRAKTFRGEAVTITGIAQPKGPHSTGRVSVRHDDHGGSECNYYPGVIDAEWVEREDQQ